MDFVLQIKKEMRTKNMIKSSFLILVVTIFAPANEIG